jgi:forkhead transcription factor HCM1
MEKRQPSKARNGPQKALFTTFPSARPTGKENFQPHPQPIYPAPMPYYDNFNHANFSIDQIYGQKAPMKRALMDAAPIQESRPPKRSKAEADTMPPLELPIPQDDGTKPGHSYAMLIGMAILRAPNRRLTLAQIYKWISETYSYYNAAEPGWQNSIRHNLSLNKAFVKQERPKDDPGKGNYWAIEPGMEHQFMKGKQVGKAGGLNDNLPVMATTLAPAQRPELQPALKPLTPAPQELSSSSSSHHPSIEAPVSIEAEPSSDATIPASDAPAEEDQDGDVQPSSPPAPHMHSSPPVPRRLPARDDTPPPVPRFPPSSRSRTHSHKRRFNSMDDSGYFSCLDSSAMRPSATTKILTSEADRPRIRRGRAEEEIARIRGSSYDSPSKTRPFMTRPSSIPPSSSPLRRTTQMLPPLTPAVKFAQPPKPPPSISPNTNLRMHRDRVRELVGSPVRNLAAEDPIPWSPAFNLGDLYDFSTEFDIFADADLLSASFAGSPEKRSLLASAKRPSVSRTRSANILHDITNSSLNKSSTTPTPLLKFTPKLHPNLESPSKSNNISGPVVSPSKVRSPMIGGEKNFFDLDGDAWEADLDLDFLDKEGGMDLMQGFQKIGSGIATKKKERPPLGMGRSFTSRF